MESSSRDIRVDRILLKGLKKPAGRWILGADALVVALFLISPWELREVLVAFWLEAGVVAVVFAFFVAAAPVSGPTLLDRAGRVVLWVLLAGGFLALTGLGVSVTVAAGAEGTSPAAGPTFVPPILPALGPTPWVALAWIGLRSVAAFSDAFTERRFEHGIGLAAGRFFVVYLPVLATTTALFALSEGAHARLFPIAFLAVLTYYELVLTLEILPLLQDEEGREDAVTPSTAEPG